MKLRKSILLTLLAGVVVLTGTAATPAAANSGAGGFVRQLGVDWLAGNDGNTLRLNLTLGYQYTERFSAGIGTGYTFYNDPVDLIPVYLDLVYLLGQGSTAPFLQLKSGYSYSVMRGDDNSSVRHRGGLFMQPGVGFRTNNLSITTGFSFDHASWDQDEFFGRVVREKVSFRRIQLGVGFHF
jgi:hypothetical protein